MQTLPRFVQQVFAKEKAIFPFSPSIPLSHPSQEQ